MAKIGVQRATKYIADYPDRSRPYYLILAGLELLGEDELARQYAEKALEVAPDDGPTQYNLACYYARAGDPDRAVDLLQGSTTARSWRSWIETDPDLDSLREHPRFLAFVASLKE